jgi:hypothetical protein
LTAAPEPDGTGEQGELGWVRVTAILFADPIPWTSDFWERHPWISLKANHQAIPEDAPPSTKPAAVLDVPFDSTLGEVLIAACDAWRIRRGPDHRWPDLPLYDDAYWIAFANVEDGTDDGHRPGFVRTLPIALSDGTVGQVTWHEATYRQLIVSQRLGVLEADVTRPYIWLARPQGDVNLVIEAIKVTADAIRAAYAALPAADHAVDEGIRLVRATARPARGVIDDLMRFAFVAESVRRLRRRRRRRDD